MSLYLTDTEIEVTRKTIKSQKRMHFAFGFVFGFAAATLLAQFLGYLPS